MASAATNAGEVDFGPNVVVFTDSCDNIASKINPTHWKYLRDASEFGPGRYAYLFKPGNYNLVAEVSHYTTVHGLGKSPTDVTINGNVQRRAIRSDGLALNNFWCGVENLTVNPTSNNNNIMVWAVSQATFLRRVHVKGTLFLSEYDGHKFPIRYSSGGFVADCAVDDILASDTQQQFLTRNTRMRS